jgi:hypothetical protein
MLWSGFGMWSKSLSFMVFLCLIYWINAPGADAVLCRAEAEKLPPRSASTRRRKSAISGRTLARSCGEGAQSVLKKRIPVRN